MTITINYKNNVPKKDSFNLVLFVDEKFNISSLKKYVLSKEYSYIFDLLKTKDLKKKIISFDINSKKKIILVSLKKNLTSSYVENLGAKFYDLFKENNRNEFILNSDTISNRSFRIFVQERNREYFIGWCLTSDVPTSLKIRNI